MIGPGTSSEAAVGAAGAVRPLLAQRVGVVAVIVLIAVGVNEVVFLIGRLFGGSFVFTNFGASARVDALTVAAFTAVPLAVGLALAVWLSRRWPAALKVAMVVAPALALVTIFIMTLPADFDVASVVSLAVCHISLAPISVLGLRAIARLNREEKLHG